ncbi:MAG: hypothetical protein LBI60_05435 [Bacteroidales bacterium]|nr:hypothetical protein [Bacteroidales bacterium]
MKKNIIILSFLCFCFRTTLFACTSAIISGSVTPDGRPILWKHHDNEKMLNRKIIVLNDGKYQVVAVVNYTYQDKTGGVLAGYNSAGFAIIDTDTGNLPASDTIMIKNNSSIFMKEALLNCATVDEFEAFLSKYSKTLKFRANLGVIDANGNGAYFETNGFKYTRYDVNDPTVAPNGYLIRTNYSFSGIKGKGHGYIRYNTAEKLFNEASKNKNLSLSFLLENVCLSLENSLTGQTLSDYILLHENTDNYIYFQECINRYSTAASTVVHGVKKGESPAYTTMWAIMGFPLTSVPIPVWLTPSGKLPAIVTGKYKQHAKISDLAIQLKALTLSPLGGRETKYFINTTKIANAEGAGISQQLAPLRKKVFSAGEVLRKKLGSKKQDEKEILLFYDWIDKYIIDEYKKIKITQSL